MQINEEMHASFQPIRSCLSPKRNSRKRRKETLQKDHPQKNENFSPHSDISRDRRVLCFQILIPSFLRRNPTTSFSTTAILAYAIGAGITAAAGTRLALQLFLAKAF